MASKPTKSEQTTLASWRKTLLKVPVDVLDRIIKSCARDFGVDRRDPEQRADLDHALNAAKSAPKADYVLGFTPVFGDDGIVAYLIEHSARWHLDIEVEKPARAARAERGANAPRKARASKVRDTKKTRTAERGGKRKPAGQPMVMTIPGDVWKLTEAMGFRKEPAEKGTTTLKASAKLEVTAVPGTGVVVAFDSNAVSSAVRLARKRLDGHPALKRAVLTSDGKGDAELSERVVERCGLKSTRDGYKIVA